MPGTAYDPLDLDRVREALGAQAGALALRLVDTCGSTNALLLEARAPALPALLLAEHQTAGRGRRGRRWISARGTGLTLSLGWRFDRGVAALAGLPLAAGVAVARALRALGAVGAALKWPNDIVAPGGKLGGILVETRGAGAGTLAVVGVGLNCRAEAAPAQLRRAVTALEHQLRPLPSRNLVAGRVAGELCAALAAFERDGLEAVRAEWESMHAHAGRRLRLSLADGRTVTGVAEGLARDGGLHLRTRTGLRVIPGARVARARAA